MVKSLQASKKIRPPLRLLKSTKLPKVRPFPGEMNVKNKGPPSGAVYATDLELEELEAKRELMASVELTSEELMRDADYLKIDQSKLPLEIFDSLEFEALDKSPADWLALKCNAKAPFFHDSSWIWRPVTVLGYDYNTSMYDVKFLPDGLRKFVHRLNLKFDAESEEAFDKRRSIAENARKEAKQIMRLDHFIIQQPNETIKAIRKESVRKIHDRIMDGLPNYIPFPEPGTPLGSLLRRLTGDIIMWYARTMKKAVLFAHITNPIHRDDNLILRYIQLKLPPVPPKPPVPKSGKLEVPNYLFNDRWQRIENLYYSSQREVLAVYRWLHDKWTEKFQYFRFMNTDTSGAGLTFPCTLQDFKRAQTEKCDHTQKLIAKDLRRAFMDQLLDCVQDIFDFFQSNITVYRSGALYKLFRVLDLKLSHFLRSILCSSLDEWRNMISTYTQSKPMLAKPPSDDDEKEEGNLEDEDSEITKSPLRKRDTETYFDVYTADPLFHVSIVVGESGIAIEPSISDIQSAFVDAINKMVASLKSVTSVDNDVMSLLNLEVRTLLNIGAGDPLYADLDSLIRKAKSEISKNIEKAMVQPMSLCEMYSKYFWVMERDVDEYIDYFAATAPVLPDYLKELKKLDDAMKGITELSFFSENFSLVRVSTAEAKQILLDRASQLRLGITQLIAVDGKKKNIEVIQRYKAILERIAQKPTNEKQLAELREFIESSKQTVKELKAFVDDNRALLGLLDKFNVPLSVEDMGLMWSTLEYPSTIETSGKEMEVTLEADKIRMMDRLAIQKEYFERDMEVLAKRVKAAKLYDDYADEEKVTENINKLMDDIDQAKNKADDFNMREKVFGFSPTDYVALDKLSEDMQPFYKLWNMVSDFHNSRNEWLNGDFKELDGKKIEEFMTDWWKTSYKLVKSLEEEYPGASGCAQKLRDETTEFRKHLPVIQSLASKALKRRHWEQLSELLGKNIDPEEDLTLQQLLDLDAAHHIDKIQEVTTAAEKEYNLERSMNAMMKEWETIEFEVKAYKESGTFVVGGIDDIISLLDDHIVKTQTMRGSPFIRPIEKECKEWEYKLKYAQTLLDSLISCQRTWMYLEPIFGSEDIMRQLPTEARRFNGVDSLWRKTMADCNADPNFMTLADPEKRLEEKFKKANEKLDEITKGLNDYLEMKRLCFPRFFFLSNDELLEILSQTKEPRAVQPHLGKCFEGINKVKFENDLKITSMISGEGETVKMDSPVDPETANNKGNVEKWLLELESIQWVSLRSLTCASIEEYVKIPRKNWILNWPAQVILGISSLYWTTEVTQALKQGGGKALIECNQKLDNQLRDMVILVRGNLSKLGRKTLGALTTIDVHNRDVVTKMVELGTHEVNDFEWMSQLRYYWEDAWKDGQAIKRGMKTLVARIVNARCLYGYEYLGNTMRLVITALTDRCYRTMIGAIDLLYGGAPEGPAGTGKTETVKDLSKAVAIHCVVFNCSDGLDYLAMAKFFKGLAGCGSWCCFDEFNRINIEVLSVIAQQILVINQAKRENKEMFHFEGTYMKINSNCNAFITMNPGYAGRAELPDNLKALFRPCAMMVPDYAMIGEIRLYSFGFEDARSNAQKIVRVLQLSSEQLSSQKHYDYGMRAVNSILVACGNLRQQLGDDPEWDEAKNRVEIH